MGFGMIDLVFILLIALFVLRGFLKGFIGEFLSMAALILGLLAALFFYKNGANFLRERFWPGLPTIPEIISFIALLMIVFIVVKLLELMLKGIIQGVKLTGVDKFLGIIFGLAEGIAVVSFILFVLQIQPLFDPSSILSDSFLARLLLPLITGTEVIPSV